MADHGTKISRSINLNPQSAEPTNPENGDIYYNSTVQSFVYYSQGVWANVDSIGSVASSASMTSSLFTPAVVRHSVVRLTGAGGNLHGMSASFTAKKVTLYNNSSGSITIQHQSATELTSNNRIITPIAGNMTLIAGEIAQFVYDSTQLRWLLVSVGSGAGAYLPATTTTTGIVVLNQAPVDAAAPKVAVVDSSERVVSQGVTRGTFSAGALTLGAGTNDSSVTISKSGATTTVAGALAVTQASTLTGALYANGGLDRSSSAQLNIGTSNASSITLGRSGVTTLIDGGADIAVIDRGGSIAIGGTSSTAIALSRTGITTTVNGSLSVNQDITTAGDFKYSAARTRYYHIHPHDFMNGNGADKLIYSYSSFVPYIQQNGTQSAFDVYHPFRVPALATLKSVQVFVAYIGGGTVKLEVLAHSYNSASTTVGYTRSVLMSEQTYTGTNTSRWESSNFGVAAAPSDGHLMLRLNLSASDASPTYLNIYGVRLVYEETTCLNVI
jgi:hypothetical protein